MPVTGISLVTHEPPLATGNVSGAGGYAAAGGLGNDELHVVASTLLVDAQCLTWIGVAGGSLNCTFYSYTLASQRASGAKWRFSFWVNALAALTPPVVGWLSLCDAAFDPYVAGAGLTTDGFRIGISGDGATAMTIQINDAASPAIASPRNVTPSGGLLLARKTLIVLDVNTDDTYELWCDQGSGKQSLTVGSLISGNVLIDRYVVWNAGNAADFPSNAIYYDQFAAVTPSSATPVVLRGHQLYCGAIKSVVENQDSVTVVTEITDAQTAAVLWTREETVPLSYFSGEPKDGGQTAPLDGIVTRALQAYQAHQNVPSAVGHQVDF